MEEYLRTHQSSITDGIIARFISQDSTHYELHQQNSYHSSSPVLYQSSEIEFSYVSSPMDSSYLPRHCSSRAGPFTNSETEKGMTGYGVIKGIGIGSNIEARDLPASNLGSHRNFVSHPPSSSTTTKTLCPTNPEQGSYQSFSVNFWKESGSFCEDVRGQQRDIEEDKTKISCLDSSEAHVRDPHNHSPHALPRHLSLPLPKKSAGMGAIEDYFQFQDSVPCKARAKRGCATHPRSIAERVRRTRISERMRKLQDLVPNMDKQTNTADMLDLAVDYIKDLQKQVKMLSDTRAGCTCLDVHSVIPAPT